MYWFDWYALAAMVLVTMSTVGLWASGFWFGRASGLRQARLEFEEFYKQSRSQVDNTYADLAKSCR